MAIFKAGVTFSKPSFWGPPAVSFWGVYIMLHDWKLSGEKTFKKYQPNPPILPRLKDVCNLTTTSLSSFGSKKIFPTKKRSSNSALMMELRLQGGKLSSLLPAVPCWAVIKTPVVWVIQGMTNYL